MPAHSTAWPIRVSMADAFLTHTAQEERLTALLDDNDERYWNFEDAIDAAYPDLDEIHRLVRDAMRESAQAGFDLAIRERTR